MNRHHIFFVTNWYIFEVVWEVFVLYNVRFLLAFLFPV